MHLRSLTDLEWEENIPNFRDLSYPQCLGYARCAATNNGADLEVVGLAKNFSLDAAAAVRVLRSRLFPFGIAYIHYGPVTVKNGDAFDFKLYCESVRVLKEHYATRDGLILRITPPLIWGADADAVRRGLIELGFAESRLERRRTILVPVSGDREQVFAALGSKWRSTLRKAQRTNVRIEERNDQEAFMAFDQMLVRLQERKNFRSPQNVEFFRKAMSKARSGEIYKLIVALEDNKIIAAHLGAYVGDVSVYLLGAANDRGRELNSSYLLHWEALMKCIEGGQSWYDLGGVDPINNAAGYIFKKAIKGIEIFEIGAYEFIPGRRQAALLKMAEWVRKMERKYLPLIVEVMGNLRR